MGEIFTRTVRIKRPPLAVWAHLADARVMAKWMPGVSDLDTGDETGELRQGGVLVFRTRGRERLSDIVDCEAPSLLTLQSTQGNFSAVYRYTLEQDGENTDVSLQVTCTAAGLARLAMPLIALAIRFSDGGQLRRLKRAVEKATPGTT